MKHKDSHRLSEILSVLRRHDVMHGLTPDKTREIFEELGPTFVKVGQILSMRPDIIPSEYCNAFQKLRTEVSPMPIETVRAVIWKEYGKPSEEVFSAFDTHVLGSASIAQVHRATLTDGSEVVVKVQRPDIYDLMKRDVDLMRKAAKIMKITPLNSVVDIDMVLDELWEITQQEMDFRLEAGHLAEFHQKNKDIRYVRCPRVYQDLTTARVLVMEYIDGIPINDVEALKAHGYDMDEIGNKIALNYIKQIIDDRFYHADPHPGNILIQDGQIVWLDMGMMGRMTEFDAQCYKNGIAAVIDHDCEAIKDIVLVMGACKGQVDEVRMVADFERFLDKYGAMSLSVMNLGSIMNEAIELARVYNVSMPKGMTMVARGITNLEGVLEMIAPSVSVISVLAKMQTANLLGDLDFKKETLSLLKDLLASGKGLTRLPAQLSHVFSRIDRGRLRLNLEWSVSETGNKALQSAIRRLAAALISCALFLGGCIMRIRAADDFLAALFLIAATALGGWAVFHKTK